MSDKSKKVDNPFLANALAAATKTDAQKLTERVADFLEDAVIDCDVQIANLEGETRKAEGVVKKCKKALEAAQTALEVARYKVPASGGLGSYISTRDSARINISLCEASLETAKNEVASLKAQVVEYKKVLADLSV